MDGEAGDQMEAGTGLANEPRRATGLPFVAVLLVVAVAAFLMAQSFRKPAIRKAPEIHVDGWLNGPGPTREDLHGKVIVLDAWAFWCLPCRAQAPDLVKLYEKYREQGVVFLGLTMEDSAADVENRGFLKATKITWPNGFGAEKTLRELKADTIPQRWVIDRQYNLIWTESSSESIEAAIDRALAQQP
jgi:thiol-disulfide isomerase/thioredoxin